MKKILLSLALMAPMLAQADEFDITMNVVDSNESFDEAIVNRIALPFSSAPDKAGRDDVRVEALRPDALGELLGDSLSGSGVGHSGAEGVDVNTIRESLGLPETIDLELPR